MIPGVLLSLLLLSQGSVSLAEKKDVPDHSTAGRSSTTTTRKLQQEEPQSRIFGGWEVMDPQRYPFFAYWDQGCGASLVGPDIILSAAHCYIDGDYGTVWLNSLKFEEGNAYEVVEVWYHPLFNGDYYGQPKYDFLLARLNQTVPPEVATPVTLNTNPNRPAVTNEELMVIGFGSLDEKAKDYPDVLHEVTIPFLATMPDCQRYWDGVITDSELCTLNPQGGMDSCYGDSGGPILTLPDLHQVGVVSWGEGCGREDKPAVASRVSEVAENWIQPQICLKSQAPPAYCNSSSVELPLSLRVDVLSQDNTPWLSQKISFGLFQINPPVTHYMVDNGVTIINTIPPSITTTATSRKKEEKEEAEAAELAAANEALTSLVFDNLTAGLYYFRISQQGNDIKSIGSFRHFQVVQGENIDGTLQHAWVDLAGDLFEGFHNQYIDLQSDWVLSEVQRPIDMNNLTSSSTQLLTIDFFYDNAPTETSWELRDVSTDQVLLSHPAGYITEPGLETQKVEVPANSKLQFQIWDTAGDGICCGVKGDGWVDLWDGSGHVWKFDGIFQDTFTFQLQ